MGKKKGRKGLTPYQGKHRTYGEFKCTKCERTWMSAQSWADTAQECKNCRIDVFPHAQSKLFKGRRGPGSKKPHLTSMCGKCKALGHSCVTVEDKAVPKSEE